MACYVSSMPKPLPHIKVSLLEISHSDGGYDLVVKIFEGVIPQQTCMSPVNAQQDLLHRDGEHVHVVR